MTLALLVNGKSGLGILSVNSVIGKAQREDGVLSVFPLPEKGWGGGGVLW